MYCDDHIYLLSQETSGIQYGIVNYIILALYMFLFYLLGCSYLTEQFFPHSFFHLWGIPIVASRIYVLSVCHGDAKT